MKYSFHIPISSIYCIFPKSKTIYSMYNYKKPEKLKEKVGDICGCIWK